MEIYRCENCQNFISNKNITQELCSCGRRIDTDYIQTGRDFDIIFSGIINS